MYFLYLIRDEKIRFYSSNCVIKIIHICMKNNLESVYMISRETATN